MGDQPHHRARQWSRTGSPRALAVEPLTLGSYACDKPGQFTSLAGREGTRVGNLRFAGEHTSSFYDFQGSMEGACVSGLDAANEILRDVKKL